MIVLRRINDERDSAVWLHLLGELDALARVYRRADSQRVARDYGHHVGAGMGVGVRPAKTRERLDRAGVKERHVLPY